MVWGLAWRLPANRADADNRAIYGDLSAKDVKREELPKK